MGLSCIICTTPYQIIVASSLAMNLKKDIDLFILPQFKGAEEYKKRIEDVSLFSEVIIPDLTVIEKYKKQKNRLFFNFGIVSNYLRINKLIPELIGYKNYETIYISSQANIGRLVCLYYIKTKKDNVDIAYFEDGEGSYDDYAIYNAKGIDKLIRYLLFGKKGIKLSEIVYLYLPELFNEVYQEDYKVIKIPNWKNDKLSLDIINKIVGYKIEYDIKERYVLIDTIVTEAFTYEDSFKYIKIKNNIIDCLCDKLIIKRHPRDNSTYISSVKYYEYSSIPFEVICVNCNIENKVLITASSTSVFMPKLLFGAEPTVILLHKMIGIKDGDMLKRGRLVSALKSQYNDSSKIFEPSTIFELELILKSI